ncbi:cytoskeleton-associated protein 2-like [Terrapene carolina triunguis]|uniref:cytoskeleton-associated protein 2-like n=1 Tax=Terrapene triunguis TaxID=2587831 RepID=UPI000E77D79D|nr:cytoskeleton-associated protein 2-like [Terrapene carolina triunguis]
MERARATAAQEERQKKLQEYLAIKGKLKCPNTKPYLKDRTNQPNPQLPRLSKSGPVVQPQKDVLSKVSKCIPKDHAPAVKNTRSARRALQHRSSNAPGSQRPKSIPPNLLGKRTGPPANLLPNKSHCVQLNRMASSSTCHQLNQIQETVKSENPGSVTDQRAVMLTQTGNDPQCGEHHSVTENLQEMVDCDKVNLHSKTVLESSENRTESGLDIKVQSRTGLNKPESKRGLVHRHSLGTAPRNNVGLKDGVTACQTSKELIWNKLAKSPPGCKVMCPQKPSSKARGSVPPSQIFTVSSTRLSKKSGAEKQCLHPSVMRQNTVKLQAVGMLGLARQPTQKQYVKHSRTCKTPGALEVGRSKQQVRAGQDLKLTRSPINSHVSKRPSVMELKAKSKPMSERPNSKTSGTANWQMNATKGKQGIKDLKKASQTCDTKSKSTLPRNCTASTCMSRDQASVGMLRNMRETPKRELLRVKEILGNQDPKTPAAENRKKQLEQWLASKGKSYKRPPMTLPAKKPTKEMLNLSFWNGMEKEEKRKQLCVTDKINGMLAECLELAEKGFPSEELFSTLSSIPEAEKFAKFWICKAKLLARNGTIDMTGLYEAAVCAGAAPIQELREVVVEFLKNTDNVYQGVSAHPSAEVSSHIVEDAAEQPVLQGPRTPCPGMREQVVATPQSSLRFLTSKPVSLVKLQVVPVPRMKGLSDMQDLKFLTPVRRSLRIEHAISRYPEMLKEHDTVVSSLDEIMAMEDVSQIVFRKNEALLEEEELEL